MDEIYQLMPAFECLQRAYTGFSLDQSIGRTLKFTLKGLVSLLFLARASSAVAPITCASDPSVTTLAGLIDCFDAYTVSWGYYNETTYNAAQPTATELAAWQTAVSSLLTVDGNCASITVPPAISADYKISSFTESSGSSYCILSELTATNGNYTRGWGLVVVPATTAAVLRHVHLSAPHPAYDLRTPQQAAALFQGIGAKSLLIPGRIRTAYLVQTDCIHSSVDTYYKTDPAHDISQPFFIASKAIRAWQQSTGGGCPSATCAFIQMHGKATTTCPQDHMFLSTGLGTDDTWYSNPLNADSPIKRLQANLRTTLPTWTISLPNGSNCTLTATTNVVGRILNGVAESRVCNRGAATATGEFVHIEQASVARDPSVYSSWITALQATFATV